MDEWHPVDLREQPCPECYQICFWCSWWRWQAREGGCGAIKTEGRRQRRCEKAEKLKGTTCTTCGGSRRVLVRREICGTNSVQNPKPQDGDS